VCMHLKFDVDNAPNLPHRVNKIGVRSTFIENTLRSVLTLISSNDIITIKINIKNCFRKSRI